MTKLVLTVLSLFTAASALAAPINIDSYFTCDGHLPLSVQVGGPRYGDSVHVDLSAEEVKQLLLPNEVAFNGSLNVTSKIGTCVRGDANPVVVSCKFDQNTWDYSEYSFLSLQSLAPDISQEVTTKRRISFLRNFQLQVVQVNKKLQLSLYLEFQNTIQGVVSLRVARELGTLGYYPHECRFGEKYPRF